MDLREMPVAAAGAGAGQAVRHPWEQSRAKFFCQRLTRHLRPGARVLDIGAGDGYIGSMLAQAVQPGGQVCCFDSQYSDPQLAALAQTAPPGLSFTRERPSTPFDAVLMLDVVEHVPDDRGFVAGVARELLAPGGVLLASVPAYAFLFTRHDVSLGHHRRYSPGGLRHLLREAGLEVTTAGGLFHSLLVVRLAQKLGELLRGQRTRPAPEAIPEHVDTGLTEWHGARWLTKTILGALSVDNWVSATSAGAGVSLPGLSVWALARKHGGHRG